MVETGGLENRCTGNRTGGSNPSPSAIDLTDLPRSSFLRLFCLPSIKPIWGIEWVVAPKISFLNGSRAIAITLGRGQ